MFDASLDRIRSLLYGSPVYDLMLGRKAPETVRAPAGGGMLSAAAAWYADGLEPPRIIPEREVRGDFRWISESDPAAVWPSIADWTARHGRWNAESWRADVLGERTARWLMAFDAIARHLDDTDRRAWAAAIGRGARHLVRGRIGAVQPWRRFLAHQGRIAAALAFPELEKTLPAHLRALGRDADTQILGDGGHIERAPAKALAVLAILIEVRDALAGHHVEPPEGLISAIDRMGPFIKAMLHGDGGFALIGGATASSADVVQAVLQASGGKGRAMTSAPHTGFHRLRAGQTTLIFDCGQTRVPGPRYRAPASFELSVGKTRILTHCGARLIDDAAGATWARALAATAAHTALVVNDTDAGPVGETAVERRDHEGARLVEARHDGYAAGFGITHRRVLYLDASGTDVRGEDSLYEGRSQPFSIRFHLYPDVRASMVAGGGEVILKPPRGRGWHFYCRYPVMLEDSVCFFDGRQHKTQQIVILGNHEPSATTVKWRFQMEG